MLTDEFLRITGAKDIPSLIEGLELGDYFIHSDYAPLVYQVACHGDPVARSIIQWAGDELGQTAVAVIRQLSIQPKEFEVVLVGSLYDMGDMLIAPMREVIIKEAPFAQLIRLSAPPVVGGVLLAMEQVGYGPSAIREHLLKSTCDLVKSMPG
jgi:N-acetylglucosamine kinase-like BadF-type ATPase